MRKKWSVVGGWVGGWMDGWMEVKAGLRIAYSNQKYKKFWLFQEIVNFNLNKD